jgi:hypothetical protein
MGPIARTVTGVIVGLNVFLAAALIGVIAVNGAANPGVASGAPLEFSAAAGASAPLPAVELQQASVGSLDLNGDGKLSLAEAAGYGEIVRRFDRADRNKDGKLTKAEFDRLAKLPPAKAEKKKPRRPQATSASG